MKRSYLAAAVLVAIAPSSYAQETTENLEALVITASRTPQTVSETLAPVSLITREDIVNLQAQSFTDLLRGLPGFIVTNTGGAGKQTSLFLRGAESDHVLVLVDGIKIGSATSGAAAIQDIPIAQIERIEVVRGPRASLYGSEAIGGVIQIFTRRGAGDLQPSMSVTTGRYDTLSTTAGLSGGGKRAWFNASVTVFETNGFNSCKGNLSAACFTIEPDEDGYENVSGSLATGYRFENGLEIALHSLHAEGENDFDGSFVNESQTQQQVLGATLRFSPTNSWDFSASVGRSQDKSDNFNTGTFMTRFDSERDTISLQNDLHFSKTQSLSFGVDYQNDNVSGTTDYVKSDRDNTGIFAQYSLTRRKHDIQLSVREDDNEQFGQKTSSGIVWGYAIASRQRVLISYTTAFKAPTFNELYYPIFGNPELLPEEANNIEIAYQFDQSTLKSAVNLFQTEIDSLIAWDASISAPVNVDVARVRGFEGVVSTSMLGVDLSANLTLLDPENRSMGAFKGNVLARRAKEVIRVDVSKRIEKVSLGTTLISQGKSYDDLANTTELASFRLVDLRGDYRFNSDWLFQLRIENLFDEDYETAAFYNQPGRSIFATVRYTP